MILNLTHDLRHQQLMKNVNAFKLYGQNDKNCKIDDQNDQ